MPTKKTTYTISEAAKKLGVTRAAIHDAIKDGRIEAEWGETVQVIRRKARLISAEALKAYRVDESRQARGKKS